MQPMSPILVISIIASISGISIPSCVSAAPWKLKHDSSVEMRPVIQRVVHDPIFRVQSPSKILLSTSSPSSSATSVLVKPTVSPSVEPSQSPTVKKCPPTASRKCCTTIQQISQSVMSPLSGLLPVLGDVEIGSIVGISCTSMAETSPDWYCLETVACCSGEDLAGPSSLSVGCKPLKR